jgi:hypothetical protein
MRSLNAPRAMKGFWVVGPWPFANHTPKLGRRAKKKNKRRREKGNHTHEPIVDAYTLLMRIRTMTSFRSCNDIAMTRKVGHDGKLGVGMIFGTLVCFGTLITTGPMHGPQSQRGIEQRRTQNVMRIGTKLGRTHGWIACGINGF